MDKQEIVGTSRGRLIKKRCVVISESFSLVAAELAMVAVHAVDVFISDVRLGELHKQLHHCNLLKTPRLAGNNVCILEGSLDFVRGMVQTLDLEVIKDVTIMIITPRTRIRGKMWKRLDLKWSIIKHQEVGGVTTSSWLLGHTNVLVAPQVRECCPSWGLKRRLKDIIKHDGLGTIIPIESVDENTMTELISLNTLTTREYTLPSFRSHTGWTRRKLTKGEIATVFDIPELLYRKIAQLDQDVSLLLRTTPGKVSQVAINLIRKLQRDTPLKKALSTKPAPANRPLLIFNDSKSIINAKEEDDYIKQYGNSAAKDDDAEIPVALWNGYVFRKHFKGEQYSADTHGKAFDMLRSGMLRRYHRNVFVSFRSYLQTTYGKNWVELLRPTKK